MANFAGYITNNGQTYGAIMSGEGKAGPIGPQGKDGKAATIRIGNVTTGESNTEAVVKNVGSDTDAVLDFVLPKGDTGNSGKDGNDGLAATVSVGTVTTGDEGAKASVVNVGNETNAVLNFVIPKGNTGEAGARGETGNGVKDVKLIEQNGKNKKYRMTFTDGTYYDYQVLDGADGKEGASGKAATVDVGQVTNGTNASVKNSGTSTNAVFDFVLPQGPKGNPGPTGEAGNGIVNIELVSTNGKLKTYRINFTDGTHFDYQVRDGNDGAGTGTGDMVKANYDANDNGIVDDAEKVNGHTVDSDVPAGAKFTDTVYDDTAIKKDITSLQNNKADKTAIPTIPTNISAFTNDKGYLTTVPGEYITETELSAKGYITSIPSEYVTETELAGKGYLITESDPTVPSHVKNITEANITSWNNKAETSKIPTKTSQLTNDSGYITGYTESDPTVPSHVKSITQANITSWSGKAEKSDIPDTSNFATKDKYGDAAISLGRRTDTGSTGTNSVATGDRTQANGNYSVAMGSLAQANAMATASFGRETRANGSYSVALGEGAIATGQGSLAAGRWNVENTTGDLLHMLGNGTSSTARSNAHTVDTSGNAWYQGDVYVGSTSGTNKDAGSKKLATESYVDNAVAEGGISRVSISISEEEWNNIPSGEVTVEFPTEANEAMLVDVDVAGTVYTFSKVMSLSTENSSVFIAMALNQAYGIMIQGTYGLFQSFEFVDMNTLEVRVEDMVESSDIRHITKISQEDYDYLASPDENVLYLIPEE
jgi:hypothetical protein